MAGAVDFFAELGIAVPDVQQENIMVRCFANPAAHAHDDRDRSLSLHMPTGRWRCHGCGEAGNAYSAAVMFGHDDPMGLAKRHGLFKENKLRMPTERRLKDWRKALAQSSKIQRRLWELKGWTPVGMARCGLGWDGERITMASRRWKPGYPTSHLKCVGLVRYLPGGDPKTKALPGSKRTLFPAPHGDVNKPMFVVEGEPDAVSVVSAGHQAVAVPGVSSWCFEFAGQLSRFKNLIVVPDCDDVGRKLAVRIQDMIPHAQIVDLDMSRCDGYDVGDFMVEMAQQDGTLEHAHRYLSHVARGAEVAAKG